MPKPRNDFVHINKGDAARFLTALHPHGAVVELRCPDYLRCNTATAGYFDDPAKLISAAANVSGKCPGVFVTLNELPPAVLARINNRVEPGPKNTTTDADVIRRRAFFIDIDPVRPAGIPADDAEHAAALDCAAEIRGWLSSQGWPMPIEADSGNGAYLIYKVNLANNAGATELIKRCLQALAFRFDSPAVSIDTSVHNAARIAKLIGTLSGKGDGAEGRPHRLSRLLAVPDLFCLVSVDLLDALALQGPPTPSQQSFRLQAGFDLEAWIHKSDLSVAFDSPWDGKGHRWVLDRCPWNDAHTNRSAYIVRFANGAIAAGCHHNGCQGYDWHSLRDLVEPGWHDRFQRRDRYKGNGACNHNPYQAAEEKKSPAPRIRSIEPYRPFPLDSLPSVVWSYVRQGAAALGCDLAFVALPVLAVLASAIGKTPVIRLKRGWTEQAILWTGLVAESGALKSPAHDLGVSYLYTVQERMIAEFRQQCAEYGEKLKEWKEAKKKHKAGEGEDPGEQPEPPVLRRVIVSDITIEKLAEILADNPRGRLVARDELTGWIASFTKYKGKQGGTDVPNWLQLNRAGTLIVDRKTGDRRTLFVKRASVSVCGTIQPGVLARALTADLLDSGFAAPKLLAWATCLPKKWSETETDPDSESMYQDLLEALLRLDFDEKGGRKGPRILRLSEQAKAVWVQWYNSWAGVQHNSEGELAAAYSKLEAYSARFALIYHVAHYAALQADDAVEIQAEAVEAGIVLAPWFAGETRRVYATLGETAEENEMRRLTEFVSARGGSITAKELQRGSRRYPDSEAATAALDSFVNAERGCWQDRPAGPCGGRPTRTYVLFQKPADETDETYPEQNQRADETADETSATPTDLRRF